MQVGGLASVLAHHRAETVQIKWSNQMSDMKPQIDNIAALAASLSDAVNEFVNGRSKIARPASRRKCRTC